MTFLEDYLKAKEQQKTVCLTTNLIKWDVPGLEVVGIILDRSVFSESQYEDKVLKYIADTDNGTVSFILGADRDEEYKNHLIPGAKFYIRFNGKKPTKGQKVFNEFVIEVWDVPEGGKKDATKST